MLFSLLLNLILFSGLISKVNTHKVDAKTVINDDHENIPEKSLKAFFFKLTEFTLTKDITYSMFTLNMNLTNSSTNKAVYEKFFPETYIDKINNNEEWYTDFIILQSQENLEISFQVNFVREISEIITIPFPELDQKVPISINSTKSPNVTFNLLITSVTYFDRLGQVNLASNNGYFFTKIPLDNKYYAFMTLKDNVSLVQTIKSFPEYQLYPDIEEFGFNSTKTFYELTVSSINYYNEEDPNEIYLFQMDFFLEFNSVSVKIGSRTLKLSKREYTQSELNLTDFKMPIDTSFWCDPSFYVGVTQLDENGNFVRDLGVFELNETEVKEIRDQSEVTFSSSYNFSFLLQFRSIPSTHVCFKSSDIKKYNNVSVLTTVDIIQLTEKTGFIEFSVGEGEKYKMVVVNCDNKSYIDMKFHILFKDMSVFHYTGSKNGGMVEITSSSEPGDISIVGWDYDALAIFLKRDNTDEKKYKVQYVFGNDTDNDIKIFEDEEKNKKSKVLKYIYLALIIVGVISTLISLYCIGRKCSKLCGGGDESSGLL